MSQQHEMEFADLSMDTAEPAYRGYRSPVPHEEYTQDAPKAQSEYRQSTFRDQPELSHFPASFEQHDSGVNPTFMMQMRLGLIIVSLILWVIVFGGAIFTILIIPASLALVIYPLVFIGLGIFTVLVVLSNWLFRQK
jgi:hypothetical protein